LAALISGRFLELPEWIGFVVTSRPDASVLAHLQGFRPFAIEAGDSRNTADLQTYGEEQIGPLLHGIDAAERERLCALLVEKSAGMMLYLRLVAEGLREGTLAVENLGSLEAGLPGLHGRYHAGFEARFGEDFHDAVQPLLRLIMAAPGPMPLDLAAEVLGWGRELAVRTRARVGSYLVHRFLNNCAFGIACAMISSWHGSLNLFCCKLMKLFTLNHCFDAELWKTVSQEDAELCCSRHKA
jgi:hypothetical protein